MSESEYYVEYQDNQIDGWIVVNGQGLTVGGPFGYKSQALEEKGMLERENESSLYVNGEPYTVGKASYSNPIDEALAELKTVLTSKRADYANNVDPFSSFSSAAEIAGITTRESIMSQIGIKLARLKNLESQPGEPKNEPIQDSALDLAGYAIILYAYYRSQK